MTILYLLAYSMLVLAIARRFPRMRWLRAVPLFVWVFGALLILQYT